MFYCLSCTTETVSASTSIEMLPTGNLAEMEKFMLRHVSLDEQASFSADLELCLKVRDANHLRLVIFPFVKSCLPPIPPHKIFYLAPNIMFSEKSTLIKENPACNPHTSTKRNLDRQGQHAVSIGYCVDILRYSRPLKSHTIKRHS